MRARLLLLAFHLSCTKSPEQTEPPRTPSASLRNDSAPPNLSAVQTTAQPSLRPHHQESQKRTERVAWYSIEGQLNKIDSITNQLRGIDTTKFPQDWRQKCTKVLGEHSEIGFGIVGIIALSLLTSLNDELTYEHIIKNPRKKAGYPWIISGMITNIKETNSPRMTMATIQLDGKDSQNVVVIARFHTEFIQGDFVDLIGYTADNDEGQTDLASTPHLAAVAVSRHGGLRSVLKSSKISLSKQNREVTEQIFKVIEVM